MAAPDAPRDVVLQAESAVSAAVSSSGPGTSGAAAILAAAAAAREGKRATAIISPGDLLGSVEALHAVARSRAPIVIHVVGDAPGSAPCPGRDEIAPALDTGAGVLVSWSTQETVDLALAARRAAEDAETPFVIVTDGGGPVMAMPGPGLVTSFLGAAFRVGGASAGAGREARGGAGGSTLDHKRAERSFSARAPFALAGALRTFGELTGRPLAPVERYETTDAEEIVVAVGQAFTAARAAALALRGEGRKVGAVGVRALRPFFPAEVVKAIARARAVAVIEPLDVALAPAGPLATSLKAAFADAITWAPGFPGVGHIPPIVSVVFATLVGSVGEREVKEALGELHAGDRAKRLLVFGSDTTA